MPVIADRPLFTETFRSLGEFAPSRSAAYIYGSSVEARSAHSEEWEQVAQGTVFVPVVEQESTTCIIEVRGEPMSLPLRSVEDLRVLWAKIGRDMIYLDITGLAHHVWAPLVKSAIAEGRTLRVVYVEPGEYHYRQSPTEGDIFDLSDAIRGISPLPGFTTLRAPSDEFLLVPLIGFEGARLGYIIDQVQPVRDRIRPVVGVPGFRAEYPFHTYLGNRLQLSSAKAWRSVYFAKANCPFSLFYALQRIVESEPGIEVKVAPIGTKPHSLGAILFYAAGINPVEIVYDHPIRSKGRTSGASRVSVFHVSSFVVNFQLTHS